MSGLPIVKFLYASKAVVGGCTLHLSVLKLRLFRNLENQVLAFPPEGVVIVGANAQGKSNLLEAIYYLETFRSFRGARAEHLIAFGEDTFRVCGAVGSGNDHETGATEVAAAYEGSSRRRKVTIDGVEPPRIGDAIGHLGAVVFSPADVSIINGSPAARRRFLDIVLSLNQNGYLRALQEFRHVLGQRNAALRTNRSDAEIKAWDDPFAERAAKVMLSRHEWVRKWSEAFHGYYEAVSGGASASMTYEPKVVVDDWEEDVYRTCLAALQAGWCRDVQRRVTVAGPHRDELRFSMREGSSEVEMREFGSGGQLRTAALALRLVEGDAVREARGGDPILLLDDAFAELDEARRERVLELMDRDRFGQVILTAPKQSDVPLQGDSLLRWGIQDGRICP